MIKEILKVTAFGLSICGVMVAAIFANGRSTEAPDELTNEELSWIEFCKARKYDPHTEDAEIVNEFLDTWRGSVEEEQAFNNMEALPA